MACVRVAIERRGCGAVRGVSARARVCDVCVTRGRDVLGSGSSNRAGVEVRRRARGGGPLRHPLLLLHRRGVFPRRRDVAHVARARVPTAHRVLRRHRDWRRVPVLVDARPSCALVLRHTDSRRAPRAPPGAAAEPPPPRGPSPPGRARRRRACARAPVPRQLLAPSQPRPRQGVLRGDAARGGGETGSPKARRRRCKNRRRVHPTQRTRG
mmetsp:Transcript_22944/g.74751  ORF Transcript_22944/g.74751 Transcript_22944/m.74751 type:complete len:211 (+) Transcript_22944:1256-1888(+)